MQETVLATPPRAWGRLSTLCHPGRGQGNTPTSVGKTCGPWRPCSSRRKHPHERGEDGRKNRLPVGYPETPPRAWGRQPQVAAEVVNARNTPTSVGKTLDAPPGSPDSEKHPHERGEDWAPCTARPARRETPPRAWGRPPYRAVFSAPCGNTPTSVGKTPNPIRPAWKGWKHPHERGEDSLP